MYSDNVQAARIAVSGRGETPGLEHFTDGDLAFVLDEPLLSPKLRDLARIELVNRIAERTAREVGG